jgi:hypothetical protein
MKNKKGKINNNFHFNKEEHKQVTKVIHRLEKEELERCIIKGN